MRNIRRTLKKTGLFVLFFSYSLFINAQQNRTQNPPVKTPVSLRADVKVEKVMDIGKLGERPEKYGIPLLTAMFLKLQILIPPKRQNI